MKTKKRTQFTDEAFDSALNRKRAQTTADFTDRVMNAVAEKRRERDTEKNNIYPIYQRRLSWAAVAAGFMLIMNLSVIGFITANSAEEQQPQEISEALYNYLDYGNETTIDWTELTND
jgi:hypothetical protein